MIAITTDQGNAYTQYINTNEVAFDNRSLGFPGVMTCQAITYKTQFGLFGFHDALTQPLAFSRKCEAFAQFTQNAAMNHVNLGECLIGVINREERFPLSANEKWAEQLEEVSQHLGFNGVIYGVRLTAHTGFHEPVYIRLDAAPGATPACSVRYKRWSKMEYDPNSKKDFSQFHALLRPATSTYATEWERNDRPMALKPTTEDNRPVRRQGRTDEGKLNLATDFIQFR
jgi:hypothetical protein